MGAIGKTVLDTNGMAGFDPLFSLIPPSSAISGLYGIYNKLLHLVEEPAIFRHL